MPSNRGALRPLCSRSNGITFSGKRKSLTPRPDQIEAHDAIISALDAGIARPLAEEPMAWGKSVLLAMLCRTLSDRDMRVLCLAHRRELLEQNSGVLQRLDPTLDVGLCAANLNSDNTSARIVVGSTPTIYRRLPRIGRVDVMLLDEAHLLGPGSSTMLARIRKALGDPPLIGVTATPYRTDSASLVEAGIFDTVVHRTTIGDALGRGLLAPLVTRAPQQGRIDLSEVPIVAGEFHARALEAAAMAADITAQAVARTVEIARREGRRSWLIFASGVAHAQQVAAELKRHRIRHRVITGETPVEVRAAAIKRFRARSLTALVNCNVLTTGFDATNIDLIAFLRATCSPVLWTQSAGRGMRVHPGKENCRLLDFGGNIFRHGPIDDVTLRRSGERHDTPRAAAKIRICPHCDEVNAAAATVCISCGADLVEAKEEKLEPLESELDVLGGADEPRALWTRVQAMHGRVHVKPGSPPSFRVSYRTELGWVSEFLSLAHPSSGARWHAVNRWRRLSRERYLPPPVSAQEAAIRFGRGELQRPVRVLVEREAGWLTIKDAEFGS